MLKSHALRMRLNRNGVPLLKLKRRIEACESGFIETPMFIQSLDELEWAKKMDPGLLFRITKHITSTSKKPPLQN